MNWPPLKVGATLDQILGAMDLDRMTLAGVNTHVCIRTTAIDAYQRDIRVVLATECIDSQDPEHAHVSMAYMDKKIPVAMTNGQIMDMLAQRF